MSDVLLIVVRALLGGALVVAFSLAGEILRPKSFAGLFAAAPAIAIASLVVTGVTKGQAALVLLASGMLVGAVAFVVALIIGIDTVKHFRALRGAMAALAVWVIAAVSLYAVAFR